MSSGPKPVYEFAPFRLDAGRRQLLRGGVMVPLTSKALDLLVVLVEHRGEVVSKDQLMSDLWPDTVVVEANLTQQISMVRKALGANQEHRYIATHPNRGYSFVEPVRVVSQGWTDLSHEKASPVAADPSGTGESGATASMPGGSIEGDSIPPAAADIARTRLLWRSMVSVVAAILVIAAIVLTIRNARDSGRPVAAAPRRAMLAILPFQNLNNEPSQEFLSDGLTEETIADLGELSPERLGVIARTSAMVYKHSSKTVVEIGHELGADYLLEGSVRRDGQAVRITAQLIRVSDQSHLWAHIYDREFTGLLALQKELGKAIAQQVRVNLAPNYASRPAAPFAPNSEAYELYLQGLFYLNQRSGEAIKKSIEYFRQSTEKDPGFALAYVGLARSHLAYAVFSSSDSLPGAAAAAARALELDDGLADAHAVLGAEKATFEFDWSAAQAQFKRAIELDPNSAYVHFIYSLYYLTPRGESRAAITEMKKVLELDPLSPIYNTNLAFSYYFARDYDRSLAQYERTLRGYPNFFVAHAQLVWLYAERDDYPNAISEIAKTRLLEGESAQTVAADELALKKSFADRGKAGFWQSMSAMKTTSLAFFEPQVYARLGNSDLALDALQRGYDQRVFFVNFIKVDPAYDSLRSDPRFAALVQRMGLEP
jgi:TolB-like protein/DNA-binding winged helix-turn-helix (wHTH) protein/Tfp pilus assembly protein PilF